MKKAISTFLFCCLCTLVFTQNDGKTNSASQSLIERYVAFKSFNDSIHTISFLESLHDHIMQSNIPLNEANQYLNLLKRQKKVNLNVTPFDYKLALIKATLAYNIRDTLGSTEILNAIKTKLLSEARYCDLFHLNSSMAGFFYNLGNTNEALPYYYDNENLIKKHRKSLLPKLPNNSLISNINSLGYIYYKENQPDSAIKYYTIALSIAEQFNNEFWIGILSGNLGGTYISTDNYNEAIPLLKKDIYLSLKYRQLGSAINAYSSLIKIELKNNNLTLLEKYIDSTYLLLQMIPAENKDEKNKQLITYYENKGRLLARQGNTMEAKAYFLIAIDSLKKYNNDINKENREYVKERYFRENIVLQLEDLEEKTRNRMMFGRIIALLLIIAAIFILLQYRFTQKLKEKNKEIARQSADLEELNIQKNKLFAIVAHDLRNPLANLQGLLSLSKDNIINENEFLYYRDEVTQALQGLNGTLENLLVWANNGMSQGIKANMRTLHAQTIVEEIIEQIAPQLKSKNLELNKSIEYTGNIKADDNFLKVVLQNLFTNAAKFSNNGDKIYFTIKIDPSDSTKVQFIIQDQGLGMSDEKIKLLSSKNFSKISTVGTKGEKGSGLGLKICFEFIEAMGGELQIQSSVGKGSTFSFDLPVV